MKKIFAVIFVAILMVCSFAFAEDIEEEEFVDEGRAIVTEVEEEQTEEPEEKTEEYETLVNGDTGEAVKALQQRLKELKYLVGGSADGIFGSATQKAISDFQGQHDLEVTGVADNKTQKLLYSGNCHEVVEFKKFYYKPIARDPEKYEGTYVRFNGRIAQVLEKEDKIQLRVATKHWDNIVYVFYTVDPEVYKHHRLLEEDKVTVTGICNGLHTYTAVSGEEITLPRVDAYFIKLR